jgi:uncharacterized cupredoxin-like copper-binding protein
MLSPDLECYRQSLLAALDNGMRRVLSRIVLTALFAIGLGIAATRSDTKTITLDLFMVDYKFIPNHLTFHQDMRYRLHMENHGKETHEVTAPVFFAAAKLDNPEVLNREHTEVVLQPGETKDLLFTAPKAGTYDLRCSDHDWNGMIGGITVE